MLVKDIGPRDATIMLVGEAPGAEEEQQGIPFCGPSGQLLKSLLHHANIDFSSCYVTNVVSERPPNNNFEYFYDGNVPKKQLEDAWLTLQKKIETIHPKVCILLGNEALKAVTNKTGIGTWRGCFLKFRDTLVMPTYHPAHVMREYSLHPTVELDLAKAAYKQLAEWPLTIVKPTLQQVLSFCEEAKTASLVSWDIETISKEVRCLGLAMRSKKGLVESISIPFISFSSSETVTIAPTSTSKSFVPFTSDSPSLASYWSEENETLVLEAIDSLFNSNVAFCGQNSISFDEPLFVRSFCMKPKNHSFDLMHAWHLLYCELPKGLDYLCSVLLTYPNYWTCKDTTNDLEEWTYNARDCITTLEATERVKRELEEANLFTFYHEHVHPLCFDLLKLQDNGVMIDTAVRSKHKEEAEKRADEALKKLKDLTGQDINPNSPKQIKELLYDKLGLPPARVKGKITTDEEAIRQLAKHYPGQPVLQAIIDFRKATKLIGTYLDVMLDPDGRVRSSYNASGTETGRLSSGQDVFGLGINLQNIPAGKGLDIVNIKDMFIAPPGRVLLKGDLKQAETMVVGDILDRLGFPQMHEHYQDPKFDVHRWAGSFSFSKPEDQITKRERDVSKIRNHSGNYMAGPHVMVKTALKYGVDIDYTLAKKLIADHKRQVPGLEKWWYSVEKTLKTTRMITNCFGRRRVFFGRLDESTQREAVAWEPQSTVGDLNNKILINLFKTLPEGCFPVLQVHDEIVIELPEDKLDECVACYKRAALVPCPVSPNHLLVIPVELSFGKDWKNTKEIK